MDLPNRGYAGEAVEIEGYVRGFARRRPDVVITTLRLADIVGAGVETAFTRYFTLPVVPTGFGFDGRIQLLHGEDALAVLDRAVVHDLPGTYNVGGDGVIMLSQAIRRAGRLPLPVPPRAVAPVVRLFGGTPPDHVRYLNYGRVVDTTRLKTTFGFTPRWTTAAAFGDHLHGRPAPAQR